jgi:hypothetical protein
MQNLIRFLIFAAILFQLSPAQAAVSPLGVGIVNPVQFPPDDFNVAGLRLSVLWGDHRDVYGLDVGVLGNITRQRFVGVGLAGGANITHGNTTILGLQLAGGANINYQKTDVYGLQLAGGMNYQTAESSITGFQVAIIGNIAPHTTIYGAQIGLYNRAKKVYGFQIGLVNVADSLSGIQIGLVNFHHTGLFAVSPIINIGF